MKSLFKRRLQLQLLFMLFAAVLVAALSVILISDAVRSAEKVLLADADRTLTAALAELDQQSQDRVAGDSGWSALPVGAQDTSLRGVSQAVLRSYLGVEGGYYDGSHFLGYSYPTHDTGDKKVDVPTAELDDILRTISQSRVSGTAERILRGSRDIVVIEAKAQPKNPIASWSMKRLSGRSEPGVHRRELLLSALVLAALISIVGTFATGIALQRGIVQIQAGLSTLESDFSFRLPSRNDELGDVSDSINRMAYARQKLEADLRREDRLRTIGRLAANVAHEIRNPLNSIRLAIQYLQKRFESGETSSRDLDSVIDEVDRLNSLLTQLLTFQKDPASELRDQPLIPVVEKCVTLIQPQAELQNIQIRFERPARALRARFDSERLTQILMNLLLNGMEAAGRNGTVDVRLQQRDAKVGIEVHDSGSGLSDDEKEHLFEAFYTTKSDGSGLGLAVSRELAHGMGGTLEYRDGGLGATFEIQLPSHHFLVK